MRNRASVRDRQFTEIRGGLRDLVFRLEAVERLLRPKVGLTFAEAIPPEDVVHRAIVALNVTGKYLGFSEVLSAYYGIPAPDYVVDMNSPPTVPANTVACYAPSQHRVYSKSATLTRRTAFHEMFHALVAKGTIWIPHDKEEDYARQYADACMSMSGDFYP